MKNTKIVLNFGRNLRFKPKYIYSPSSRVELIDILQKHNNGKIRVVASKHSWSDLIETEDVLIDMSHFDYIRVQEKNHGTTVTVGALSLIHI